MRPVNTVGQVFDAIQQVKAGAPAYCTNFFPVQRKLGAWIDHEEFFGETQNGAAFFFRRDRDFWHLYFCAASMAALEQGMAALPGLKTERIMIDLVGDENALGSLLALLESTGFRRYTRLCRMTCTGRPAPRQSYDGDLRPGYAVRADCDPILNLLDRSFDRYAEQLPTLHEIETAVDERQILAAKCGDELAGLLFFETQGFTSAVRYWLVVEKFRASRYGSALMRRYFAVHSAVQRFVLWVVADNAAAIQKYQHYGFVPDKLVDQVLANEMIRPMKSIAEMLKEIRPEFDFTTSNDFVADGMLDSYDIVTLVAALDKTYGISISGVEIVPENFKSLQTIETLLRKYTAAI